MSNPLTLNREVNSDILLARLAARASAVERALEAWLVPCEGPRNTVIEAMRYGSLGGGKRLRPFLLMESARLFDVPEAWAVRAAMAIEMIHCYSLIDDDLPAMDDSDLRRGQATTHKVFGDASAILAGDGLLTEAFAVLAEPASHPDAAVRTELIGALANAAGVNGMVGGQMIDISPERDSLDLQGITDLQRRKTGALILFACEAGAILGRASADARAAVADYAADVGLAFQIADDLLDLNSTPEELGKPTGQDAEQAKATFVRLLGEPRARARAHELVERACQSLEMFGEKADILRETARFVVLRES